MLPVWPKNTPGPKLNPRLVFSDYLDPSGRVGTLKMTIRLIEFKFTFTIKIIISWRDCHTRPNKMSKLPYINLTTTFIIQYSYIIIYTQYSQIPTHISLVFYPD